MPQCIPLIQLERGNFESLQAWADPENLEGMGPDLGKADILNIKLKLLHCAESYISYMEYLLTCAGARVCVCVFRL